MENTKQLEPIPPFKLSDPQLVDDFLSRFSSRATQEQVWKVVDSIYGVYEANDKTTNLLPFPFDALKRAGLNEDTIAPILRKLAYKFFSIRVLTLRPDAPPVRETHPHDQSYRYHYLNIDSPYDDSFRNDKPKIAVVGGRFELLYKTMLERGLNLSQSRSQSDNYKSSRPFLPDVKWEDITMRFLNGEEVILEAAGHTPKHTIFSEMQLFMNKVTKRPNKQWVILKDVLAQNGGKYPEKRNLSPEDKNHLKVQISKLRAALHKSFQIGGDPFHPHEKIRGYFLKIKLIPEAEDIADALLSDIELERRKTETRPGVTELQRLESQDDNGTGR